LTPASRRTVMWEPRAAVSAALPLLAVSLFFWRPLFTAENFVYRDAGHFYYPLYRIVAAQWEQGWWPLWNPYENGGTPLLANPAAAVLYPVRIALFQWSGLDYSTAYKLYIIGHAWLAAAASWWFARRLGLSHMAASFAATAYALSAAVAFQYCNVIFLVGAAWLPIGLEATERLVRQGGVLAILRLSIALSMQVLGGDPEAAYIVLVLAIVYICVLNPRYWCVLLALMAVFATTRRHWPDFGILLAGLAGLAGAWVAYRPDHRRPQRRAILSLALAGLFTVGLTAVQWMPTLELTALSRRAAERSGHSPYGFDVPPWRVAEYIWPAVFGRQFSLNTRWVEVYYAAASGWLQRHTAGESPELLQELCLLVPFEYDPALRSLKYIEYIWVPTLYGGVLVPLLAVVALKQWGFARVRWLVISAVLLVVGSLGRWGLVYQLMVHGLPGFASFRYPGKLLVPAALMLAILSGVGLEQCLRNRTSTRRATFLCVGIAAASAVLAWVWLACSYSLIQSWTRSIVARATSHYGPLVPLVAWRHTLQAFAHAALAALLDAGLLRVARTRPAAQIGLILALVLDIFLANGWLVVVAPQNIIDRKPRALAIIEADATKRGISGPFRVFRAAEFTPRSWWTTSSRHRAFQIFRWEKETIQPKYGEPWEAEYVITETTLESYDYWWFFAPFFSNTLPGRVVYYPRRGFDLWGTRYLILPTRFSASDEKTAFASLAEDCKQVYRSTAPDEDYQILWNPRAFPRAWLVHRVVFHPPIRGLRRADRMELMRRLLYPGPTIWWHEPKLDDNVFDPTTTAVVETDDPDAFPPLSRKPGFEEVLVIDYTPQHVRLDVRASGQALLVLADAYYPGWVAYVDDRPVRLYRVNRMMRGVVIPRGQHVVTFEYRPRSFTRGACVSLISAAVAPLLAMLVVVSRRLRRGRRAISFDST